MTPFNAPIRAAQERFDSLRTIERLLLTTDGTVTPMIEHVVGEHIVVARVTQHRGSADAEILALLATSPRPDFLFRATDLVGAVSGAVYMEATSVAVPGALPDAILAALLDGDEPIGRLLRRERIETYREILDHQVRPSDAGLEGIRSYRIFVGGVPALLIRETFFFERLRPPSC